MVPSLKELQSSLASRSSEVNDVIFDIQLFVSERAPDLTPEQSRQLLGQLQQLQRSFQRASGQAQARVDALIARREQEEERERLEEEKKDKERKDAKETEVWKEMLLEVSANVLSAFLTFLLFYF